MLGSGSWACEDTHCSTYLSDVETLSLAMSWDLDTLGIWLPWQSSITHILAHHIGSMCSSVNLTHCPI